MGTSIEVILINDDMMMMMIIIIIMSKIVIIPGDLYRGDRQLSHHRKSR